MIIGILEFAAVFGVVPEWVYFRGQQVRYVSQLLKKVRVVEAVPQLLPLVRWPLCLLLQEMSCVDCFAQRRVGLPVRRRNVS